MNSPLVVPGDYNIDFNQKLAIMRFEKYGQWDVVFEYIESIILWILFLILCYVIYRIGSSFLKGKSELYREKNQFELRNQFKKEVEKRFNDFVYLVVRIEEEKLVMGIQSDSLKKKYYNDLFSIYKEFYAWEDMFEVECPKVKFYLKEMKNMMK